MQISKTGIKKIALIAVFCVGGIFSSCKKQETKYEYGVKNEDILPANVNKTRLKTTDQ